MKKHKLIEFLESITPVERYSLVLTLDTEMIKNSLLEDYNELNNDYLEKANLLMKKKRSLEETSLYNEIVNKIDRFLVPAILSLTEKDVIKFKETIESDIKYYLEKLHEFSPIDNIHESFQYVHDIATLLYFKKIFNDII